MSNPTGKYSFVPAGCNHSHMGGLGIYVTYKRNTGKKSITIRAQGTRHLWAECPDRDLYIVTDSNFANSLRPMQGNYDEYIDLGIFNPVTSVDMSDYMDIFMTNYTTYIGKEQTSPNNKGKDHRDLSDIKPQIMADSGGYQILTGRLDYLDPKEIVGWYNDNVDMGMVLDLPVNIVGADLIKELALVQAKNTQIMMDNKRDSLELINIMHGATDKEKKLFKSICERPDIDRLAMGGFYFTSIVESIRNFYTTIQGGQKYKHVHVLGVANIDQIYLLMRLAHSGVVDHITSDGSSYLQEAVHKRYFVHSHLTDPPDYRDIGDIGGGRPNADKLLPCGCPVCSNIRYMDILSNLNGNIPLCLLTYHNMFAFTKFIRAMDNILAEMTNKELKQFLSIQMKTRSAGRVETPKGIDFIDHVQAHGLEAAVKKFQFYLSSGHKEDSDKVPALFANDIETGSRPSEGTDIYIPDTEEEDDLYQRAKMLIHQYSSDEELEHGKKGIAQTKGHMAKFAKAKKGPGNDGAKAIKSKGKKVKKKSKGAKSNG